jgi:hypothetical protein
VDVEYLALPVIHAQEAEDLAYALEVTAHDMRTLKIWMGPRLVALKPGMRAFLARVLRAHLAELANEEGIPS